MFRNLFKTRYKSNDIKQEPTLYVKLKKLDPRAEIPTYAHKGDVGMDMKAISVEYDAEHDMYIYHTGLAFESNFNVGQFLFPRSSNSKKDCYLTNSVGIADSAIYRGEIQFRYKNRTSLEVMKEIASLKAYNEAFENAIVLWDGSKKTWNDAFLNARKVAHGSSNHAIEKLDAAAKELSFAPYEVGDKIGQMVFMGYPTVHIEEVSELSETSRGEGGFGSTGK